MCIRYKHEKIQQVKTGYKVCIRNTVTEKFYSLYSLRFTNKKLILKTNKRLTTNKKNYDLDRNGIKRYRLIGFHYFKTYKSAEKLLCRTRQIRILDLNEELVIVRVRSRKILNTGFGGTASYLEKRDITVESKDLYIHPFVYASNQGKGIIYGKRV